MEDLEGILKTLKLRVVEISHVPESYSSQVYLLTLSGGERVILKRSYNKAKLHRECRMLKLLADVLPVPRLIEFWEEAHAMLLSYIPGLPIMGPIDTGLAFDMGALLAGMHRVSLEEYELVESFSRDWWGSIRHVFRTWLDQCKTQMPDDLIRDSQAKFYELYEGLPLPQGPCAVHFDYRPGNILVDHGKIVGLIDFESSRGGSADLDFVKIKTYVWDEYPGTETAFLKGYTSIRQLPDIHRSLPLYTLYNAIGGISWCVRRGQVGGAFYEENMASLLSLL